MFTRAMGKMVTRGKNLLAIGDDTVIYILEMIGNEHDNNIMIKTYITMVMHSTWQILMYFLGCIHYQLIILKE